MSEVLHGSRKDRNRPLIELVFFPSVLFLFPGGLIGFPEEIAAENKIIHPGSHEADESAIIGLAEYPLPSIAP
jgi:hypothetical protein